MSHTYKDTRAAKYRRTSEERWNTEYEKYEYTTTRREYDFSTREWKCLKEEYIAHKWIERAGVKPKQKRNTLDFNHYWYKSAPSWWVRTHMTVPKRAACRNWEKTVVYYMDMEDVPICPDHGRKPHQYYW